MSPNIFPRLCYDESLLNEEIKYLTKEFHEINNYLMSIINSIAWPDLNHSQNKDWRAQTNENSNKIQLILSYHTR